MNKLNIIFYSANCKFCVELIKMMKNEDILQHFKMICIDGNLANIPKHITKVPAIITSDTNKLYMADDAFKWFQAVKFMRQQQSTNNIVNKPVVNDINTTQRTYMSSEMSGISDTFAYTNVDVPLPKSFMNYKEDDKNFIYTPPKDKPLDKRALDVSVKNLTNNINNQVREAKEKMAENITMAINKQSEKMRS